MEFQKEKRERMDRKIIWKNNGQKYLRFITKNQKLTAPRHSVNSKQDVFKGNFPYVHHCQTAKSQTKRNISTAAYEKWHITLREITMWLMTNFLSETVEITR